MVFSKRLFKLFSLLLVIPLYWGIASGCSGLSPLNSGNGNGNGSGDSQEETRNTPPPNPEAPPFPILVAGGGNCPSGQCTEESHGGRDPHSGTAEDVSPGGQTLSQNGSNSQPTQTAEGTDPDPNDSKFNPKPCPPGVDCNRTKRDSRDVVTRPEVELVVDSDIYTNLINGVQVQAPLSGNSGFSTP